MHDDVEATRRGWAGRARDGGIGRIGSVLAAALVGDGLDGPLTGRDEGRLEKGREAGALLMRPDGRHPDEPRQAEEQS